MLSRFLKKDLILMHAPSVYDFRKESVMFGPISDVVPSSAVFEMYPVGQTSIADTLERNGYNVQIINIAYKMLQDANYDPEEEIARLKPRLFGIDLHWLPHAHGAVELAKICKKYHPEIPVMFGGLSSSYFHEELISHDYCDFVVRGDSTEEPIRQLMSALRTGGSFREIPNLTWKKPDGTPVVNELSYVPDNLDYTAVPSYRYVIGSVFKYGSLKNVVPYVKWLNYPTTALLTARGCTQNCSVCGGSKFAYERVCNRRKPAFRSPETLIEDIRLIQTFGSAPIFILHDIRQAGMEYARRFFDLLKKENIRNELVIELFYPADEEYFKMIAESVPKFSLEVTIESHDEKIRMLNGKFKCTNEKFEETLEAALKYNCRKIDIFFMTGIPKQTYENALESIDYCRHLLERFNGDPRLALFISPLAPFLDPGSLAYEKPEIYGYKKFCHTLEDHRKAICQPSWKHILSYETDSMTRDEIVEATYETAYRLNELKYEYNLIDQTLYEDIKYRIQAARETIAKIDAIMLIEDEAERKKQLDALKEEVAELNKATICGEDELKWDITRKFAVGFSLFKLLSKLWVESVGHGVRRLFGIYDRHPLQVPMQRAKGERKVAAIKQGEK
ncbi:TIGR04190 family B12-binding domain/radical SAM domain protein [Rubeoparvulum massiliense]|uniref:TIGR04190 family B12-binding domain/radical SAM domain protein n=1 Tax=Rubeoparvulum massiliense TaxID=1631346 RepID=UPI00065E8546|nr:TIGR04190 family B12-binding domain/radical SAM domain protein [Rubeoparvulum massiliense]